MKKIKKLWQIKFFKNYFILEVSFILLELIFRIIDNFNLLSYDSLRILIGISIIAGIFSYIETFLPKLGSKILNLVIIFITSIYGIVELGFYNFIGVYASLQMSSQAEAVKNYIWDFLHSFNLTFYIMLLPFVIVLLYYILIDKKVSLDLPKRKKTKRLIIIKLLPIVYIIILSILYYGTLKLEFMQNKFQSTSALNLIKKPNNPSLEIKNFGLIGFGILDIKECLFPGDEITDTYTGSLSSESITYSDQITIDTDEWLNLIDEETDSTYNTLNNYFISNNTSSTNEYTGIFEGKNVIMIMIESGSNIMLNEEYYPNLAKLYNEGWTWDNYYAPRTSCSTGNNEVSAMTGLYSIYNVCNANVYKNNTYFESIFNLFNNKGYTTNSFHDYPDHYYYRTTIHKNMGSSTYYKVQDMNMKYKTTYGDWPSDVDMMEFYLSTLDELDTSTPFMSWITTVTSHQPYTDNSEYNLLYQDLFPSDLSDSVRSYMSKLKVVDEAIGVLLDGLEERNLLDDTVIVLFADHYPYGIKTSELSEALGYDASEDNLVDQVPFIIYNSSLTPTHYDEYTSYVNTTPTIANLFNLDFDSRLYMGSDVLDSSYSPIVIFIDGSWKNEIAYYNASTGVITYYTKKVYSDEEILAINEEVSLKLKMSSSAIKNNYFEYLNNAINTTSN